LKSVHLNDILANFCCFIMCDFRLHLPEPVTYAGERKGGFTRMIRRLYANLCRAPNGLCRPI